MGGRDRLYLNLLIVVVIDIRGGHYCGCVLELKLFASLVRPMKSNACRCPSHSCSEYPRGELVYSFQAYFRSSHRSGGDLDSVRLGLGLRPRQPIGFPRPSRSPMPKVWGKEEELVVELQD